MTTCPEKLEGKKREKQMKNNREKIRKLKDQSRRSKIPTKKKREQHKMERKKLLRQISPHYKKQTRGIRLKEHTKCTAQWVKKKNHIKVTKSSHFRIPKRRFSKVSERKNNPYWHTKLNDIRFLHSNTDNRHSKINS